MPHASIGATPSFERFGEAQRSTPDLAGFPTVGKGAPGRVPAAEAERPLSVQSGDLRAGTRERARCAVSGRSPAVGRMSQADYFQIFAPEFSTGNPLDSRQRSAARRP